MNIFKLIKSIPFLTTLLIIIFLSINNQSKYTKLKIFLWDTPSLSLGTYLAISSVSGFLLSYIISTKIAENNRTKINEDRRYLIDNHNEELKEFSNLNNNLIYDNTLIERDIKDPSPTIKANFRVIGKITKKKESIHDSDLDPYENNNFQDNSAESYYKKDIDYSNANNLNQKTNDWNDNNFLDW